MKALLGIRRKRFQNNNDTNRIELGRGGGGGSEGDTTGLESCLMPGPGTSGVGVPGSSATGLFTKLNLLDFVNNIMNF
jgi:hypothetical protein